VSASDLALALEVAVEAGELLMSYFGKAVIEYKGDKNLVTDADRAAEELIIKRLTAARPHDSIVAEEGSMVAGDNARRWYVDPLDGTNNFAHGFWVFAVSIGLVQDGALRVGAVHAPSLGQTFAARRDGGAMFNGKSIHVSGVTRLADAICATGFPYARRTLKRNNIAEHNRVLMEVQGMRRVGVASLDLCWTAAGRWDGYWELHLAPWDVAAGILVCQEAGGMVTDFAGRPVNLDQPEVVATNGLIHDELRRVLNAGS
jgi:myo-inositol-1(or 4)-monophosphatase